MAAWLASGQLAAWLAGPAAEQPIARGRLAAWLVGPVAELGGGVGCAGAVVGGPAGDEGVGAVNLAGTGYGAADRQVRQAEDFLWRRILWKQRMERKIRQK